MGDIGLARRDEQQTTAIAARAPEKYIKLTPTKAPPANHDNDHESVAWLWQFTQ